MTAHVRNLLITVGVCPVCLEPWKHDFETPFANCRCGTTEWPFTTREELPILMQLQLERHEATCRDTNPAQKCRH